MTRDTRFPFSERPRPLRAVSRFDAIQWASPPRPTLAAALDQAALTLSPVIPVKAMFAILGGLAGVLLLPWGVCLAWTLGCLGLEAFGWFASRRQARGQVVNWGPRTAFVAAYLAVNVWWVLLGVLLWRTGTPQGEAVGSLIVAVVGALIVLLFYNAPLVFLLAGAAPACVVIAIFALADGRDWRQMAPIWVVLGLGMVFCLGRAIETPSVQEAQRRLNHALENYEILAENITDVMARSDMVGAYQYVSPACLGIYGYRPDELIGMSRMDIVDPACAGIAIDAFQRMLADPDRTEVITIRLRHKAGHWLWVQSSVKLVSEDGAPVGVIDVSRDVTAQVETAAALEAARLEAEAATRAKDEFLANISHEIRTPMNGILGALHLLKTEAISPQGRDLMRMADDSGHMLSQLLNDILDVSRIESGQFELAPEPVQPGEMLDGVAGLMEGRAQAKGLALRWTTTGGDLWIAADPVRLRQAMFNLIGNAVKFTAAGHVAVRLDVGPAVEGSHPVTLEVEDTGIGIAADAQAHLFERFRQARGDTARHFGGAGLGLSITRSLARLMGGDVTFTSVEGQGSVFCLRFDAPGVAAPVLAAAAAAAPALLDGLNILLVEDNPANRLVAHTLLTSLGADVMEAKDGHEGLAAMRAGAFDLVLMDIQMPRMDGMACARAIRGLDGPARDVPILALTANVMAHQVEAYRAAGMDGVVAKPISPTLLIAEIGRLAGAPDAEPLRPEAAGETVVA
ncbi:MAG: Autoinducer 2 sensor kinase/phosphatase LuxQ [Caulobacter sp.]|nr:Autoinducer 2 sensor kinase/phosphatase LuxQ [Caulobacter sp.]